MKNFRHTAANDEKTGIQCEAYAEIRRNTSFGFGLATDRSLCRGVAKLVKASDFDSDMRRFESFFPCHTAHRIVADKLFSLIQETRCAAL